MSEIKYVLNIENNSKQTFQQVDSDTQKQKKGFEDIGKSAKDAAKSFGQEWKKQTKGILDGFKLLLSPIKFVFDLFKTLTTHILKTVVVTYALGKVLTFLGNKNSWNWAKSLGTHFDNASNKLQKFVSYLTKGTVQKAGEALKANLIGSLVIESFYAGSQGRPKTPIWEGMKDKELNPTYLKAVADSYGKIPKALHGGIQTVSYDLGQLKARVLSSLSIIPQQLKNISNDLTALLGPSAKFFGFFITMASKAWAALEWIGEGVKKIGTFLLKYIDPRLMIGFAAAVVTTMFAFKSLNKEIERGSKIGIGAQRLGIDIGLYQGLDNILKQTGSSIEEASMSFMQLNRRAFDAAKSGDKTGKAFKMLGVEVKTSGGALKNNSVLINETLIKLSKMRDVSLRNALALEIFGRQGYQIIPMLDEYGDGLDKILDRYQKSTPALKKFVDASRDFKKTQEGIRDAMDEAKASLFTGTIERLTDTLVLFKNSGFVDVFYGILKVVMLVVNELIDGFNVVFGLLSVLSKSFMTTVYTMYSGILWLMSKVSTNPAVKKHYQDVVKLAQSSAQQVIEAEKQLANSAAKFATGGLWTPFARSPKESTTGTGTVIPDDDAADKLKKLQEAAYESWKKFDEEDAKVRFERRANAEQKAYDKFKEMEQEHIEWLWNARKNAYDRWKSDDEKAAQVIWENRKKLHERLVDLDKTRILIAKQLHTDFISYNKSTLESLKDLYYSNLDPYKLLQYNAWVSALGDLSYNFLDTFQQISEAETPEEKMKAMLTGIADAFRTTFATISQVMALSSEKNISELNKQSKALDKWYNNEKATLDASRMSRVRRERAIGQLDQQRLAREEEIEKKIEAERARAAKSQLTLQLIQGIGSIALGVSNALALGPLGIIPAAVIGAMGAVQIGLIASQLSKFAQGGIVGGNSTSGDNNLIRANSGEMVLTQSQQAQLFKMANGYNSGNMSVDMSVNIQGNASTETVNAIERSRSKQMSDLEDMLYSMSKNGRLNHVIMRK